jgi:CDP-diacylglycerol---serine O-phosphatidyltransferase
MALQRLSVMKKKIILSATYKNHEKLQSVTRHIPNLLTCANLFMGCLGIVEVFRGNILNVPFFIWIAVIFDFLDGFLARLLGVTSSIGKELDSLADMVTFGLLPSILIYSLIEQNWEHNQWVPIIAFMIAIFSALRLAKFNVDARQSEIFIGLPTPANALFFSSFPLLIVKNYYGIGEIVMNPIFLIAATIIFSFLLVAELPLFALKFKSYNWKGNEVKYIFLMISIGMLILLGFAAIPLIIILYLILSLLLKFL